MNRKEVSELLNRINNHFFGKITQFMNDKSFFDDWYDALKDYEYDLILYVYKHYENTDFPPTAKYFQIEADRVLKELDTAVTMSIYSLCSNCYLSGDAKDNKELLANKLAEYPYGIRGKVLIDIVGKIPVHLPSYSVNLAEILKEYKYER